MEDLKKFDSTGIGQEGFEKLVRMSADGVTITQSIVSGIKSGREVTVKRATQDEIDAAITELLTKDRTLLEKYKENKNVVNFIVGQISRKYGLQPKDVLDRIKFIIQRMSDN